MELADIMVYDEKFNQAILYYAQVEDNLKTMFWLTKPVSN